MKKSPIAQFLRRIRSSDQTGYWRSVHRAKKLNLSIGVHGSKSVVSRGRANGTKSLIHSDCIASVFSVLHTQVHTPKE